jgi:hypothetical protein
MTANHYSFHLRTMWSSVPETVPIGVATPASKHIGVVGGIVTRPIPALDDVRFWRILLKKSLLADERNFSGPLVRPTRGDVRDHIDSRESDHRPSHPFYGALQRLRHQEFDLRENFGAVRFSPFSTVSAHSRRNDRRDKRPLSREERTICIRRFSA